METKTTTQLRDQNLLVANEPLDPKVVQNEKTLKTAANKLGKKAITPTEYTTIGLTTYSINL